MAPRVRGLKATSTLGELVIPEYFEIIRVTTSFNPGRFLTKEKENDEEQRERALSSNLKRILKLFSPLYFFMMRCSILIR